MDEMTVHVECTATSASEEARAASARSWRTTSRVVGVSARINVQEPGNVARSEGKAKRVVDNRNRT
jgi:phenylacetate-CoA ligase